MSSITREIITLQLGHYANFVGTHWWNLQEASFVYSPSQATDINHDYLFREGLTAQRQETYTPRLLAIDQQGSLGTLPVQGRLYAEPIDPATEQAAWTGKVDLIQQLQPEKNEFLKNLEVEDAKFRLPPDEDKDICIDDVKSLDIKDTTKKVYDLTDTVEVWSDFLCPHLHPKAIYLLNTSAANVGRACGNSDNGWHFLAGLNTFRKIDVEDEITDRIRSLAESCNSLQGFQILSDVHDGMGGVCAGTLQHLADEYSSKDSVTFTTSPHTVQTSDQATLLMQASILQSYAEISQFSSVVIPLNLSKSIFDLSASCTTFKHLVVKEHNRYVTSSVLAAFLDTVTLAYRHRSRPLSLASMVEILTPLERKFVGGSLALPLGINVNQNLVDFLHQEGEPCNKTVSAGCSPRLEPVTELLAVRGVHHSRLRDDTKRTGQSHTSAGQVYSEFLQSTRTPPSLRHVTSGIDPLWMHASYPNIFVDSVTQDGYVDTSQSTRVEDVSCVPCLAGLHQGGGMTSIVEELLTAAQRFNMSKVPLLQEEGLDKEAWVGVTERLQEMYHNYCASDGVDGGTNSDDDDDDLTDMVVQSVKRKRK